MPLILVKWGSSSVVNRRQVDAGTILVTVSKPRQWRVIVAFSRNTYLVMVTAAVACMRARSRMFGGVLFCIFCLFWGGGFCGGVREYVPNRESSGVEFSLQGVCVETFWDPGFPLSLDMV